MKISDSWREPKSKQEQPASQRSDRVISCRSGGSADSGRMDADNANILSSLKATIAKSGEDILAVAKDGVSLFGDTDILKEIPFVSIPIKLLKIKDAFHEARLKRNVMAFLKKGLNEVDRDRALAALSFPDPKQADDFIDTLFTILLESEKPLKAEILGNLFRHFVKGTLSYDEFDEFALTVIAAPIPALRKLKTPNPGESEGEVHALGSIPKRVKLRKFCFE
jgi:hypothetical protein